MIPKEAMDILLQYREMRDEFVRPIKHVAIIAREIENIVDGLVLVDCDGSRRDRARIKARVRMIEELRDDIESRFI